MLCKGEAVVACAASVSEIADSSQRRFPSLLDFVFVLLELGSTTYLCSPSSE